MKKIKKFLFGTILAAVCAFSACGGITTNAAETATTPVVVNSFENQSDLNYVMMQQLLGKITLQEEKEYITDGDASMKVWVQPNLFGDVAQYDARVPAFMHTLNLKKAGKNYTSFRNVASVKIDVYNAETTEQQIGVNLAYKEVNRGFQTGRATFYTLAPEAWTTVTMEITSLSIPQAYNKKAVAIGFVFDRPTSKETAGRTFYVDNFRLEMKES
ncbi:MAG: hypothetical protein IJV85_02500 [Clostridia bacterium]|nr:hypothetical protein [Clostridia bacterium]